MVECKRKEKSIRKMNGKVKAQKKQATGFSS